MTKGLTGIPALAYLGVNAGSPPNIKMYNRDPNINDSQNFIIGDLWINTTPTPPASRRIWMLVSLGLNIATWVMLYPTTAGGGGNLRSDDTLIEIPDPATGAINVYGGEPYGGDPAYINMYTNRLDAYTLYVNLKRSINQPNTNATATEGMYKLGSSDFMHNYGTNNTALGHGTLNLGLTVGLATDNTAIGHGALNSINLGGHNTACGSGALTGIEDGEYSIGLGFEAGKNLDGADSDDIMIGSPGVLGDLNCIRIGQGGVGPGLQDKLFIPAVWEGVAEPGVLTGLTLVNANGKMYVDIIAPNAVLCTDAAGNPIGQVGLDGEVLIGKTGDAPLWKTLTAGAGVGIANGPNSIVISAGGVGALLQLGADDAHTALPVLSQINIVGSGLINTSVTPDLGQDLSVNITQGTTGQVIAAVTGSDPIWKDVICSDGSLLVTNNAGDIDITVIGVPPVGGVNALLDHALLSVPPTLNHIQIEQGANITTVGDIALSKITINVTDDVDLAGHLYATTDVKTSTGNLVSTAGNLILPNTDGAGTIGAIRFGAGLGTRWIHNYGTSNVFVGPRAGNNTLTTARYNVGMGLAALEALTTGEYNTSYGNASSVDLSSGSSNSAYGRSSLYRITTGNRNQCFGAYSGYNYTGAESDNVLIGSRGNLDGVTDNHTIRIGWDGGGDYQQQVCYIAGIFGKTPGATPEMVTIGSDGKLGTAGLPTGGATKFVTDSGTATVSGVTIQVKGGANINTSGATNIVTVNLDTSVKQPMPKVSPTSNTGVYALYDSTGAGSYNTDRFMHAWGYTMGVDAYNTFLGRQAGQITATAIGLNNTALGALALDAYTSASNCVAVGKNALTNVLKSGSNVAVGVSAGSNLTSSSDTGYTGNNILIGNSAGATYTTGFRNIVLGDDSSSALGGVGEYRTMRLGFKQVWSVPAPTPHNPDPVETLTTHGTDKTYVYGIYKNTVAFSGTPVYVDHLGKLGTEGGVAFSVHLVNALTNVTGDGTVLLFGTSALPNGGLMKDFDTSGSVTLGGSGAPMVFTAPYAGKYVFTASVTYTIPAAPPPPIPQPPTTGFNSPLYLITSNLSYTFTTYIPPRIVGLNQRASEIVTAFCYLDAGDTVVWACQVSDATKVIGILNYIAPVVPGYGTPICNATYFTGYRMS